MIINELGLVFLLILLFATSLTSGMNAQEPLTGNVEDPYLGCSFGVPEGWTAYKTGTGYLMASATQKGFILILQNEYRTVEALQSSAMEGISDYESGIILNMERNPESFMENGIQLYMSGSIEGQTAKAYAIGLISPFKQGWTILTAVDPSVFSQEYVDQVQKIAREITFKEVQVSQEAVQVSQEAVQWKESLSGMRLTYMNTYSSGSSGGYSDKIVIDLCPGGIFSYSDQSTMSLDVNGGFAYSHDQNSGDGNWSIIDSGGRPTLQLSYYDGNSRTFFISVEGETFYLDNRRYFRTRDAICQ